MKPVPRSDGAVQQAILTELRDLRKESREERKENREERRRSDERFERLLAESRRQAEAARAESRAHLESVLARSDQHMERLLGLFADEQGSVTEMLTAQQGALDALHALLKEIRDGQGQQTEVLHGVRETLGAMRDDLHAQAKVLERIARGLGSGGNGKNGGNAKGKR